MKTTIRYTLIAAVLALGIGAAKSQLAYFTNTLGGDWNTAANWDLDGLGNNVVPAVGTNANIGAFGAVTVDYNAPMAATSFGALTLDGGAVLNINAAGFNQDLGGVGTAPITIGAATLNVNSGGVLTATNGGTVTINLGGTMNVSGTAYIAPLAATAPMSVSANGSLNVLTGGSVTVADGGANTVAGNLTVSGGNLVLSNSQAFTISPGAFVTVNSGSILQTASTGGSVALGVNNNNTTNLITINGGTVTFDTVLDIRGRKSALILNGGILNCLGGSQLREANTDDVNRLVVSGGQANLGNFEVHRTLATGGLMVSNGVVNATALRIGRNNSSAYATVWGGVVTNTGAFTISDRTNAATSGERRARFLLRGGTVVSTDAAGIIIANQFNLGVGGPAASIAGILDINAGTLIAEGITLVRDNTLTNAHAVVNLAGSGIVYLGSVGMVGNTGPVNTSYAINMSGGTFAAKNNFSINANVIVTGTTATFQAADASATPFNITANSVLSGAGALTKTGAGTLSLQANNTYSGVTTINGGTLALGASGAISNTTSITVGSGATFDVSALAGGFPLNSSRTLFGAGTVAGNVAVASGGIINPGTTGLPNTLTFNGSVTQTGGTINHFDLAVTPGPGNDRVNISQDLNVSGVNTVEIVGGGTPGTVYTLFQYGGAFNGSLANFTITGASGVLSNSVATKTIALIIQSSVRNPTSVVWIGNPANNLWDVINTTNWQNTGTAALDYFVNDDIVLFNNAGAANPNVSLVGNVLPASLTVGATANYTFGGNGSVSGTVGLVKTNTGTLTINTTNSYSGVTTIGGGVVEASNLANGGAPSAIGSSPSSSGNLTLDGGTLRYTGATVSSDRGATVGVQGGAVDISSAASTLTMSGVVTGDGSLTKAGTGTLSLTAANNYTNGTVINAGVLQIAAGGMGSGPVTNNGATLRLNTTTTAGNVLEWNGVCTVDLNNVGGNQGLDGAWSGSGTVNVINQQNNTRILTVGGNGSGGGTLWNFSGTINMGTNDGTLRFNDGGGTGSGPNFGSSNAVFNLGTGTAMFVVRNGGTTTHLGAVLGGSNTRLSGRGSSAGIATYRIGGKNTDAMFAGIIQDTDTVGGQLTAIIKTGTGKWTLSGTSTHTGTTTVEEGTLQVDGVLGNTAVDVGSTAVARLSGNGSIAGSVTVGFFGVFSPGTSVGQMSINSLTLGSGCTNLMEIDKANGTNDSVIGLSTVSYGGVLVVNNLGGTLADGDVFKLFDATEGGYFGAFEIIELPTLTGPNLFWDTSKLTVDGTIRVYTPKPVITEFGLDGSNLYLTGNNGGNTSTHYIVVTSTNVAAAANLWTPVVTNTFAFDGSFGFTNAVNPATPARFFRVKTP